MVAVVGRRVCVSGRSTTTDKMVEVKCTEANKTRRVKFNVSTANAMNCYGMSISFFLSFLFLSFLFFFFLMFYLSFFL